MKKCHKSLLVIVFILAFVLRFYNLQNLPAGLNQDESAIGYNAYSILLTGRDEHNKHYPLYFESFGDYKLPVYIYLTVLTEKLFGINELAVRFPSALLGSISVIVLYFFVKDLLKSRAVALFASLFLTFNPWHLFFSRAAFEANVATSFLLFGIFCLLLSLREKYGLFSLSLSLFFTGLSVYSYNVTRLAAPLILIIFILFFRKEFIIKFNKRILIIYGTILSLILLPFLATLFSSSGLEAQKNILIFGGDSMARTVEFRSVANLLPHIIVKLLFNTPVLLAIQYFKNLAGSFNSSFFFVSGDSLGGVGLANVGMFHVFEVFTIVIGAIEIIRRKIKYLYPVVGWVLIGVAVVAISGIVPRATRSYIEVIPLTIISAFGLYIIYQKIKNIKRDSYRLIAEVGLISIIFYSFSYLLVSYFIVFPAYYTKWWRSEEKELANYFSSVDSSYQQIVIDRSYDIIYTSLLFYEKYPPARFQKEALWNTDLGSGFRTVSGFGKYSFNDIHWAKEIINPSSLLVMPLEFNSSKIPSIKTISGPVTPIAIATNGQIQLSLYSKTHFRLFATKNCYILIAPFLKTATDEKSRNKIYDLCY